MEINHLKTIPPPQLSPNSYAPGQCTDVNVKTPVLFQPIKTGNITLKNRIIVSPMCMYSSTNGFPSPFHLTHIGQFALHGVGTIIMEASAVEQRGRISCRDLGLYLDDHAKALGQVVSYAKSLAKDVKIGIQLAHAGRKGSTHPPFINNGHDESVPIGKSVHNSPGVNDDENIGLQFEKGLSEEDRQSFQGFETVAPSDIPHGKLRTPKQMTNEDIKDLIKAFCDSARRADEAGFDIVEIHAAHGYLLHQFLSPLANKRNDNYGGSFENRIRLVVEVCQAVKQVWPAKKAIWIRFSCTDWVEGGWDVEDTIKLSQILKQMKLVDAIDCSAGGVSPLQKIPEFKEGYQSPYAKAIYDALQQVQNDHQVQVIAVGGITDANFAESLLQEKYADMIMMAREFIRTPTWVIKAAKELEMTIDRAPQYRRGKEQVKQK